VNRGLTVYIYIYIYMCVCVCVSEYVDYIYIQSNSDIAPPSPRANKVFEQKRPLIQYSVLPLP